MKKTKSKMKQKMDRGDVFAANCPSRSLLNHITSKWGILIFLALGEGETLRFSDLKRKIQGISEKMLGQNLKILELDGFIIRKSYPVVPPVVEYRLTREGLQVANRVIDLTEWLEENLSQVIKKARSYELDL